MDTLQDTENTLKFVYVIDAHGFIITSRVVDIAVRDFESNEIPHTMLPPVHKPKWNGNQWIEGATQEEIDKITGSTLDAVKFRKIDELDEICKQTILGRFKATINEIEYEFSYDVEAQSRFNGIGLLFFANKISEIEWTAYENGQRVRIMLNQSNFDIVSLAALHHQNVNVTKYNQLLQQVYDATTKEQVEVIIW